MKVSKALSKREFACADDANREVEKINSKELKKVKFYDISYSLRKEERRKRGRPTKDAVPTTQGYRYFVEVTHTVNQEKVTQVIDESCCFVLCSNDLNMSGEKILREYKTQDCVEKKFKQLKSPQFVNSIYLESPQRRGVFLSDVNLHPYAIISRICSSARAQSGWRPHHRTCQCQDEKTNTASYL